MAANRDMPFGAVGPEPRELEIPERPVSVEHNPMRLPARLVRRHGGYIPDTLAESRAPPKLRVNTRLHVSRAAIREPMVGVALPEEVRGHSGQAAKARLALAQPAPERVDLSADDRENRQEPREQQPAHPFFGYALDGLWP